MQDAGTWYGVSAVGSLATSQRGADTYLVARFLQTRAMRALLTLNGLHTIDLGLLYVVFAAVQAACMQKHH